MNGKTFLDSNILLYAHDRADLARQARAREVIRTAGAGLVISTQVLQEFFVAATRKLQMPPHAARGAVLAWLRFEVVQISPERMMEAIDIHIISQISFWDALIVAAAEAAHCGVLITEDLNHGQVIHGVRIENPFRK